MKGCQALLNGMWFLQKVVVCRRLATPKKWPPAPPEGDRRDGSRLFFREEEEKGEMDGGLTADRKVKEGA